MCVGEYNATMYLFVFPIVYLFICMLQSFNVVSHECQVMHIQLASETSTVTQLVVLAEFMTKIPKQGVLDSRFDAIRRLPASSVWA